MSKTTSISVTVSNLTNKRFEELCKYWRLSKSRCIEDIINKQYFELQFKEGVNFEENNEVPP